MFISNPTESRINELLRRARQERWHAGTRQVKFDYYKREVAKVSKSDVVKRDWAIGELREIFGYTASAREGYNNV